MNKEAVLKDIFLRRRRGIRPGLERMKRVLHAVGDPQKRYGVIHIAGTNGKGSSSAMAAAVLRAAGFHTGLFTSPHICDFRERFCINGTPVADTEWMTLWEEVRPLCDREELTFFEISTLLALLLFAAHRCEWVVLETGMGGRLDATNCLIPEVACITSISMDHMEYLGNTLTEIAEEKLGIVKPGVPVVVSALNSTAVHEQGKRRAHEIGATYIPGMRPLHVRFEGAVQYITYEYGEEYMLPLLGEVQASNLGTIIPALKQVGISSEIIRTGIQDVYIPARIERFMHGGKEYLFDTCHTPEAVENVCRLVSDSNDWGCIIGMMKDKDYTGVLSIVERTFKDIAAIRLTTPRSLSPALLQQQIPRAHCCDTFQDASAYLSNCSKILVMGSFYTVEQGYYAVGRRPYDSV
ncbi:bifunctional folylpolyglutamate synthase/dihydrofolate synthase [Chitinivibrio alkaliphilus]|uniref:Dihydrofolate synthase/folylpolyglutamate synthase n=1 Tax=Chitinivibrio alkaliphilus ACht1 TaxID=1313304 RepID=U7DEM2_9BACT|nr:Mur ligase family protein [Chitinivibrio alkaliphilus]ERP39386.1 folylpolyglutamate synthase [Chitinivibrio alkaliphilus ACht1]